MVGRMPILGLLPTNRFAGRLTLRGGGMRGIPFGLILGGLTFQIEFDVQVAELFGFDFGR